MTFEECKLISEKRWSELEVKIQKLFDADRMTQARLNKLAAVVEDIQELNLSVAKLADNMQQMLSAQREQNERLKILESKPAKRWESVVDKILMLIVGALIGFVLLRLGINW